MEIHTFRASSLQEALMLVRHELGPEASVLQTREISPKLFGMWGKRKIEVDATRDAQVARRLPDQAFANDRREHLAAAGQSPRSQAVVARSPQVATTATSEAGRLDLTEDDSRVAFPIAGQQAPSPRSQSSETRVSKRTSSASASASESNGLTPAMFEVFTELLDSDVEPESARLMLQQVSSQLSPDQLTDPWLIKGRLCQAIQQQLDVSGPITLHADRSPYVVALVGPTGVGKTTTLAKLAAGFHFDQAVQVGFITLDTFRLGAVDQLRQYADLLSAPCEVVSAADQLRPALDRLAHCQLILIDTAGRSPRDADQLNVLQDFLGIAEPDETHLVLSATSSRSNALMAIEQFAELKPSRLILSKLDETTSMGSWYPVLASSPWPLSYLTTGQHVPDDLLVANRRRIASLILGQSAQFQPM